MSLMNEVYAGVVATYGEESHELLVSQVKDLQRSDQNAREQWVAFTDLSGQGKRDPSKHTADFLKSFLVQLSSGAKLPVPVQEETVSISEMVKLMQKKSSNFKNVWAQYCFQCGGGKNDPMKHDSSYHLKFFDFLAQQAYLSMSMDPMAQGAVEPPAKRMRGAGAAVWSIGVTGDSTKEQLVQQVKNFQRQGEPQKELWGKYADLYLGGVRDPSRHDAATLQEFCTNHGVPPVDMGGVAVGMAAGMGGIGAGMGTMGSVVGVMGSAITSAMGAGMGSMMGGGLGSVIGGMGAGVGGMVGGIGGGMGGGMVGSVAGIGGSMGGGIAGGLGGCVACGLGGGIGGVINGGLGGMDGNSSMAALGGIGSIGALGGMGDLGSIGGMAGMGGLGAMGEMSNLGGITAMGDMGALAGMGSIAGLGSIPGMAGMAGIAGMVSPGSVDCFKEQYVAQVKNFQRMGDPQKELWGTYADMYLGGVRDPARHDAATLQEFCQNHNVPPAPAGGSSGVPIQMDPAKEILVQRIKNYQRAGNDQKEAWNMFAGATRDPARHDSTKLQEFIAIYNIP